MLCSAWPDWANLSHGGRSSIPITKGLSHAQILLLTLLLYSARARVQTPTRSMAILGDQFLRLCGVKCDMALLWLVGVKESGQTDASKVLVLLISRTIQIKIQIGAMRWWEGKRCEGLILTPLFYFQKLVRLVQSPLIDSFLQILYGKVMICEVLMTMLWSGTD